MVNRDVLEYFGFKFGMSGGHSSRTMMLAELEALLTAVPCEPTQANYAEQIVELNLLSKPTVKARQLTLRHLIDLYSLDPEVPLFRIFWKLWDADIDAHPVLALTLSLARDPILSLSRDFILDLPVGQSITRANTEELLRQVTGDRLSAASLKSYAQNINGSWTQAGYLSGRVKKHRKQPRITAANITFCLFLAYLEGATGERLFSSKWVRLLGESEDRLYELAQIAALRGLLVFRRTGGVTEVRFPDYLTQDELEKLAYE
ncbi:MAG: hypothetical protein JAZ11_11335 [Candidatus Thiodiazotropha lotti]|nr:hypothetical protein [Candidatus Thiodiazotropha lotti]